MAYSTDDTYHSLRRGLHAAMTPDYSLLAESNSDREDEACRDTDSLTDWLGAACMGQPVLHWQPVQRVTAFNFRGAATSLLTALAFDAGQPAATRIAALDELRTRYLASASVQRWMDAKAAA